MSISMKSVKVDSTRHFVEYKGFQWDAVLKPGEHIYTFHAFGFNPGSHKPRMGTAVFDKAVKSGEVAIIS